MNNTAEVLALTQKHAVDYLASIDQRPVNATTTLTDLRRRLDVPLSDAGVGASQVIDDLVAATEGGHLGSVGGRFFAWVTGGALPSALAADWLVSTWDNKAAIYASGPASAVVEEVAGRWILDLLGLPASASYAFTTGCQMARLTCLAAARHALLGARRIRVLTNEHRHGSVTRALRFLGLGAGCLEPLRTDSDSRIVPHTLEAALRQSKDIGIAIVADSAAHKDAMAISASYLSSVGDARDQMDWTPDWTRRSRGFPVYAALRELGRNGLADLIDGCCAHAAELTKGLAELPGVELVAPATLNQGLVRFLDDRPNATPADHDARTDRVIDAINREGTAFFSGTRWKGRRAMRISVVNGRTGAQDVDRTLKAVAAVLAQPY